MPVLRVHGGIRHLETTVIKMNTVFSVHGGIRHLEMTRHLLS